MVVLQIVDFGTTGCGLVFSVSTPFTSQSPLLLIGNYSSVLLTYDITGCDLDSVEEMHGWLVGSDSKYHVTTAV